MSSSQNDEGNGGGDQQGSAPCAAMPSPIVLPTGFSHPTDSSRATRTVLSTELCIVGSILMAEITAVLGRTLLITDPPGSFHQLQGDGCRTWCSASVSPLTTTPQPLRLDSPNLSQVCKPQQQPLFGGNCLGNRRSEPGACFCCYLKGNARRSLDSGVKPAVKHWVIYVADVGHHAGFSQPNKALAEPASQPHRAGSHGKQSSARSLFLSEASRSVSRTAPGVFMWFSVGSQTLAATPGSLVMCTGAWEGETKSPLHQCRSLPAAGRHRNVHLRARTRPSEQVSPSAHSPCGHEITWDC